MAYATPAEVEELLGRPLTEAEITGLEIYLDIIADVIDEWILESGREPSEVSEDRKRKVSILMGEQAVYALGVDPFLTQHSITSGDSSASSTRSSTAADRFLRPQKLYYQLLGIKRVSIASANICTSWR